VETDRESHLPQPPPGDFIRDELTARSWTHEDLARIIDRPLPTVNEIINGKRAVMPEMAVALGAAFGTAPEVWIQREADYRLSLVQVGGTSGQKRARLHALAPIKEMQRRGWIRDSEDADELEREVLAFLEISSLDEKPVLPVAMRRSMPDQVLTPAQRAWCFQVRRLACPLEVAPFSPDRLEECEGHLRVLAAHPQEAKKVPKLLASYGVRFVVVEPLPGSKVDGVALWLDPVSPVIGLSLRFDRIDGFWHTLGHEFSHIKHGDALSLDTDLIGPDQTPESGSPEEQRANSEAAAMLIPPEMLESFIIRVRPTYSRERIIQFANRIKIHPGIIVGQLQFRKQIGYNANRELLAKVRDFITSTAAVDGWGNTLGSGASQ
jgi:HTH-type transcriptional regulator / antitoxin HigA